jgi:hypothetical protein
MNIDPCVFTYISGTRVGSATVANLRKGKNLHIKYTQVNLICNDPDSEWSQEMLLRLSHLVSFDSIIWG